MLERLTFRDELGVACYKWKLLNKTKIIANEAISRLAAYEGSGLSPEEVQELAKAKAEGRLVVLPCKVGDMVYHITPNKEIDELIVTCVGVNALHLQKGEAAIPMSDIGKTVFLTREEAEKAIGGGDVDKG